MDTPRFFGIHAEPTMAVRVVAGLMPFILLIAIYLAGSYIRRLDNPSDKLTPSITKMVESVSNAAFKTDDRSGGTQMLNDTIASLKRLFSGLMLAVIFGSLFGIHMSMLPGFGATLLPFIKFISIIPPLAILPILLIIFGVGEVGKIALIFIGTVFLITRVIYNATEEIPEELKVKALTLGAGKYQLIYRIILPQIMPKIIIVARQSLGAAWLFLIASEAIASSDGLGYRIFLVRRYLSMDLIIPYVLWITFIGFAIDSSLQRLVKWLYPWYMESD